MRASTKKSLFRSIALHASLVGAVGLFAAPFVWLLSTSAKAPDEMYPPRWIPPVPRNVVASPYIGLSERDRPVRPALVTRVDWDRLRDPIHQAIARQLVEMSTELPEVTHRHLEEEDLAGAVFGTLLRRAPDGLFEKVEPVATDWFVGRMTDELVLEVFERVYQRVALASVVLHGWDLRREDATPGDGFEWALIEGDARLVRRSGELLKSAQEVHYSYKSDRTFVVHTTVPIRMEPSNFKKVVVSNHSDSSWHRVNAIIEIDGRKYLSKQAAYTGSGRWQETTWQIEREGESLNGVRTWTSLVDGGASDFEAAGFVSITLEYRYQPRLVATMSKYLQNYRMALQMVPLSQYMKNSFLLVLLNIVGQVLASSLVAFAFARLRWPGRDVFLLLVLATVMIPPQVTMVPVFLIFKNMGLYNTLAPLWMTAFFGSAFYIFLLRQFMRGIPRDLEDSAKIDGCGFFAIYWRIILPLMKPALATVAIFTFLAVWNDFMGPLIYLSDQELYPLSLGLFALRVFQPFNHGVLMAACVVMSLPVLLLFFFAQRYFIQGVTLTGLKG